jgi:hypothetical protein
MLLRTAGQYLTLFFHQHTEAKDVITSKVDMTLSTSAEVLPIYPFTMFLEISGLEALNFVCNSLLPDHEILQLIIWFFYPLNCNASDL